MKIKLSKSQWNYIGKKAGWIKTANDESTERVRNAIKNSKEMMPDYWNKTLNQRSSKSPMVAGSRYDMSPDAIEKALLSVSWEPFNDESIGGGAVGFKSNLSGYMGMIDINKLNPNDMVKLDDRKGTGFFSIICKEKVGDPVDYTVILVGPEKDKDVIWTFFPGSPTPMKNIQADPKRNGEEITVEEAKKMGFEFAKVN